MVDKSSNAILPDAFERAEELPSLPPIACEILRLAQDPKASFDDYAAAMAADPTLSEKLLSMANSSLFNMGQEISTLERAMLVLGLKGVQLMALSFSLISGLKDEKHSDTFDEQEFWQRSLMTAVAGRQLGRVVAIPIAEDAFLCGLLASVGQLVLSRCLPNEYAQVQASCDGWPSLEHEAEQLGFDSIDVSAKLLESWGMPEIVHTTISSCRDGFTPEGGNPIVQRLAPIVLAARRAVSLLLDSDKGPGLANYHASCLELELHTEQADTIFLSLEQRNLEASRLLGIEIAAGPSHIEVLEQARGQLSAIGLSSSRDDDIEQRSDEEIQADNLRLLTPAVTNPDSTLGTREYFNAILARELNVRIEAEDKQSGTALGMILFEIDQADALRSKHGHGGFAKIQSSVGRSLHALTRGTDAPAHFDDERFAVIVPKSSVTGLQQFAARLQAAIAKFEQTVGGNPLGLNISVGGACLQSAAGENDKERLLAEAARQLECAVAQAASGVSIHTEPL